MTNTNCPAVTVLEKLITEQLGHPEDWKC